MVVAVVEQLTHCLSEWMKRLDRHRLKKVAGDGTYVGAVELVRLAHSLCLPVGPVDAIFENTYAVRMRQTYDVRACVRVCGTGGVRL